MLVIIMSANPEVTDFTIPDEKMVPFGSTVVGPHFESFLFLIVAVKFKFSCIILNISLNIP